MDREELETRAKALMIGFNSRTSDEVLAERIEEAEGRIGAVEGEPEAEGVTTSASGPVMCRVLLPNLWTSAGKYLAGDDVALPRDEADTLDRDGKVVKHEP